MPRHNILEDSTHIWQSPVSFGEIYFKEINVGPCYHGMARPHVADVGTASNVEASCE